MQKKLIALAVAGLASTGAFAQSNVTVYGTADVSFDVVRASNVANGYDLGNTNRVSSNSSHIGFKGAEALGNGLTALFQIESGVNFDTGNASNTFASRDTFAGLSSTSLGTVVFGKLTGPTRAMGGMLDVNAGSTGIGANAGIIGKLGNNLLSAGSNGSGPNIGGAACATRSAVCTSVFDDRWTNAVAYVSPTFAGLNATVAYVANENKSYHGAATSANATGYDLGLKYANGPIMAGVTYNALSLGNSNATDVNNFRLGGMYDFGMATVRVLFDRTRGDHMAGVGTLTQNVFGLGGTFNVTPAGKIIGQVYVARDLKANGSSQNDTGAKLFEVGYVHSLSKRTSVRAVYAHLNNDSNANYDYGIGAVGVSGFTTTPASAANGLNATLNGVQLGLRHSF